MIENGIQDFDPEEFELTCNPEDLRIGIIRARFNEKFTKEMLQSSIETLLSFHLSTDKLHLLEVPGAYELPFAASQMIKEKKVDGVITLGCLIKGETIHFDLVAEQCARGIQHVMLEHQVPIAFGVITALNVEQARFRASRRDADCGKQVSCACIEMIQNLRRLSGKQASFSDAPTTIKRRP